MLQKDIAAQFGCHPVTVSETIRRYHECGDNIEAALTEKPRPRQPSKITPEIEAQITAMACEQEGPHGRGRWNLRLMGNLAWWETELQYCPLFAEVTTIRGDHHFAGRFKKHFEQYQNITVEISETPVERSGQTTMPVHKGRWVVERTIAWITNSWRLARDYERLCLCAQAYCTISSVSRMLRNSICLN